MSSICTGNITLYRPCVPPAEKGQQGLQRSLSELLRLSSLTGVSPPASSARKIPRKIFAGRREAVSPEQQSVQTMKRPQRIPLCILKGFEALWAFSCPVKPSPPFSTDGNKIVYLLCRVPLFVHGAEGFKDFLTKGHYPKMHGYDILFLYGRRMGSIF